MGKISGAAKRKKKKEREKALAEHIENLERLKLGPTKLWTGLVVHHVDIFAAHVLPKLNTTDRWFFSEANSESQGVLEYAGVDISKLCYNVDECSSISTLKLVWNNVPWGKKFEDGDVMDQAWFCEQVAGTNKLEFLKWAREVKHCGMKLRLTRRQIKVISRCSSTVSLMVARVIKKSRAFKLLVQDTSTVFDCFSKK